MATSKPNQKGAPKAVQTGGEPGNQPGNQPRSQPRPGADDGLALYAVAPGRSVEHDAQTYGPGDELELSAVDAQPLLDLGAVCCGAGRDRDRPRHHGSGVTP